MKSLNKKRNLQKTGKKQLFSFCGQLVFGLGAVLLAEALFGGPAPLKAVEPVKDGDVGVVTLTGTDDSFPVDASYTGSQFSGGLRFTNDPSSSVFDFTNNGTIGTGESAMSAVNATKIGTFTNKGMINFTTSMSSSALNNESGAFVNSESGNLTAANDVTNSGTIDVGGTIKAKSLINDGLIQNAAILSVEEDLTQTGTIENNGTIENIGLLSVGNTLTNSGDITNVTDSLSAKTISNSGKIDNVKNLMITTALDNENGGILSNIDSITGSVTNQNIIENVDQIAGKLTNNGTLKITGPTVGTTTISELENQTAGTLEVRIAKNDSVLSNDLYIVENSALLNGGSVTVSDLNSSEGNYRNGDTWKFLEAGALEVTKDLTVKSNVALSPILKFKMWSDSSSYYLGVTRAKNYAEGATTYNQKQFGEYLDNVGENFVPGGDLEYVLTQLDARSPDEEISQAARHAMAEMDGAVYGSLATLGIQNQTIFNQQLTDLFRPQTVDGSDVCSPNRNVWGKYYNVDGHQSSDGNAHGGDYRISGVIVGGDLLQRNSDVCFRLGAYFGSGASDFQVDGLQENSESDAYRGGIYFVRSTGTSYLLGNVHCGYDNYFVKRQLTFLKRSNRADFGGKEVSVRVEKGWNTPWGNSPSSIFQPFGAFQYVHLNTEAFTETGEGTTALSVNESSISSYRSEFGGRMTFNNSGSPEHSMNMSLKALWIHEFGDINGQTVAQFSNPDSGNFTGSVLPYNVKGNSTYRDWCDLGCGLDYTVANTTFFGGYDCLFNGSENYHTGNVGIACQY